MKALRGEVQQTGHVEPNAPPSTTNLFGELPMVLQVLWPCTTCGAATWQVLAKCDADAAFISSPSGLFQERGVACFQTVRIIDVTRAEEVRV